MRTLFIINDAPYGSEKAFNALRIANQIGKDYPEEEVRIFLMADAVACAVASQAVPNGYYSIERMMKFSLSKGAKIKMCGTCADARGLKNIPLLEGVERSTMAELAQWTIESEKSFTF